MIETRLQMKIVLVVFGAGVAINLFSGVLAGRHGDWVRMSLGLFAGVLFVFFATMSCCMILLKRRLDRLEARFHMNPPTPSRRVRHLQAVVEILMVLSLGVNVSLSYWAGLRGEWLRMHLHLSASAITAIVCTGVLVVLAVGSRLSHLERQAQSPQP